MQPRHLLIALLALALFMPGCGREEEAPDVEAFSFVVFPGARYLGQLSDHTREAHRLIDPQQEPPPVAIYDTEASLEEVARFYVDQYGYGDIAPEAATNTGGSSAPKAYYRSGDLATDVQAVEELLKKMEIQTDSSKAAGQYRAVEIAPRPNRPRVTISRPYFDVTTSEVVDRTLILMSRDRPAA